MNEKSGYHGRIVNHGGRATVPSEDVAEHLSRYGVTESNLLASLRHQRRGKPDDGLLFADAPVEFGGKRKAKKHKSLMLSHKCINWLATEVYKHRGPPNDAMMAISDAIKAWKAAKRGHEADVQVVEAETIQEPPEEDTSPPGDALIAKLFSFKGQKPIRAVVIDGVDHYVGVDVCDRLAHTNASAAFSTHCKGSPKHYPLQTQGGPQKLRVLSRADVLRLVTNSTLPAATEFETWLFEIVLPEILSTGGYTPRARIESKEEQRLRVILELQQDVEEQKLLTQQAKEETEEERDGRRQDKIAAEVAASAAAEKAEADAVMARAIAEERIQQEQDIASRERMAKDALKPAAAMVERIANANGNHSFTEASKLLKVDRIFLINFLLSSNWIYKQGSSLLARKEKITAGLMMHRYVELTHRDGSMFSKETARLTDKGVTYVDMLIRGNGSSGGSGKSPTGMLPGLN